MLANISRFHAHLCSFYFGTKKSMYTQIFKWEHILLYVFLWRRMACCVFWWFNSDSWTRATNYYHVMKTCFSRKVKYQKEGNCKRFLCFLRLENLFSLGASDHVRDLMDFLLLEHAKAAAESGEDAEVVRAMDDTHIDQIAIDVFLWWDVTSVDIFITFLSWIFYFYFFKLFGNFPQEFDVRNTSL